ncbi:MAG TPA: DUF935 domain-containing protein [Rhodocyclaceae bacterium]|nr:DUF935 domain-containing protein [Rhodocyclaceae bacterium]
MAQILDQFGRPITTADFAEPQTARLGHLVNQYLESSLDGLTPGRLAATLRAADAGDLMAQQRLFSDMEDRDPHLVSEFEKRKNALTEIDWDIVPPLNASKAEEAAAAWVKEIIQGGTDPLEDLIVFLMEATGHGYACAEYEWRREGREWIPAYHPRPQEWFKLDPTRTHLRLADMSVEGLPMQPFGWVWHTPKKPKTGYGGRLGLHRVLSWPFLYKAYSIGDFATLLETYGLPIITGKYSSKATPDEKASLMRAVTQLGHDARAIMPMEMQLEIHKMTGGGDGTPHMTMVEWAEKSQSKAILGGTLTSQADGKTSTNALGNVHNEVRKDILAADARQLAATLTRDLVYPLIALNKGGIDSLRRCPRLVFDTGEPEDMAALADALPKLSTVMSIPAEWAYGKLRIPQPKDGEAVLGNPAPAAGGGNEPPRTAGLAALAGEPGGGASPYPDQAALDAALEAMSPDELAGVTAPLLAPLIEAIKAGEPPEVLMGRVADLWPGMDESALVEKLSRMIFAVELLGRLSAQGELNGN